MADENSTAAGATTTTTTGPLSPLIPNLPDDISLQCIARIPNPYHSPLSTVSKSWRATVRSPEFFNTRLLLRSIQPSVFLHVHFGCFLRWYLVKQNHLVCKTPKYLCPIKPLSTSSGAAFAVLTPKLYVIGGLNNNYPSNNVWVFDCRFGTWEIGPKMRVGREFAEAGVVNGKIYVMGGHVGDKFLSSMNWIEVFDPVIGVWTAVSCPTHVMDKWMHSTYLFDGKIYARSDLGGRVVYNVVTGEWATNVPTNLNLGLCLSGQSAEVNGVMYCYDLWGKIRGYDVERDAWIVFKVVNKSLPKFPRRATMANLNGNLCVVWHSRDRSKKIVEIMRAEIKVWKDDGGGLSGYVLCSDVILSLPYGCDVLHCLTMDL